MLENNARKFTAGVMGSDWYGSAPIRAAYMWMSHTDVTINLENLDDFVPAERYSRDNVILGTSEYGTICSFRIFVSSNGSSSTLASGLGATVYNNIVSGWDGYGSVYLNEYNLQAIYRPPIYDGALALNASLGWKMATVPRIKNDQWVVNFRSTQPA